MKIVVKVLHHKAKPDNDKSVAPEEKIKSCPFAALNLEKFGIYILQFLIGLFWGHETGVTTN